MNRESSPRQSDVLSEEQKLIEELAGHTNISMQREALALCSILLRRKWISPVGFDEVVRVIGMFGSKKRWPPRLEAALARQSAKTRRALQGTMLSFYGGFDDWENAVRFASTRDDLDPCEIALAIEAFALAGRLDKVRRLGKRIELWIDQILSNRFWSEGSRHALGFLWYGLGIYESHGYNPKERKHGRELAVMSWNAVSPFHPFGPPAGNNSTDMLLCLAHENVSNRIKEIERMYSRQKDETALSLPGNHKELTAEMLARFNRCRRALERLVPEKRRKELGMDRSDSED